MERNTTDTRMKQSATLWQLLYGLGATIVSCTAFVILIRADVNAVVVVNERQDKEIEGLQQREYRVAERSEQNQKEIMEKLNKIELRLENKQDRK